MADQKSWGTALFKVNSESGAPSQVIMSGYDSSAHKIHIAAGENGCTPNEAHGVSPSTYETSDHQARDLVAICPCHRVIVCKDGIQWILQQRKNGGGKWPWRALGYFWTRKALMRLAASLCKPVDPAAWAALAALPKIIGG
ncbi:hypothetical protein [Roseovarius aestuariivivens]|uniref:hypothetical protein n=1 Tax=Roseovarius aestuariivivens TaxID=1888910 RepID=UPI0010811C81|nr:hypothetical protein [Roseovarius aestuariivivens]